MPPYDNRQILEVEFPLEGGSKKHPAVILSVPKVYETEQYYICAMISSIDARDQFSFPINDEDVTNPFEEKSQVRTHLIAQIFDDEIVKTMPINYMTKETFNRLVDYINENVFGIPFSYN